MSTRNHMDRRTLVTIQCQPLHNAEKLDANNSKFGVQIKSEYQSGNSEMRSNSRVSELCDLTIKSEYPNSSYIVIDDSPRKSPRAMAAHVKQEISTDNIKTEPVEVKCEYNDYSHASNAEQTIFKTENKFVMPFNKKFKMQETKCKMESNDVNIIYRCCNKTFSDKYLHFDHMLSHSEHIIQNLEHHSKKKKRSRKRKQDKHIQCYYCPRVFNTESDMIRHAKSTHTGFFCSYYNCHQHFPKKRLLLDHMVVAHNVTLKSNERYCQPAHMTWKRQTKSQTAIKKSLQKIKTEGSTCNIKVEPVMDYVKTEFQPIIIKAEPKTESAI